MKPFACLAFLPLVLSCETVDQTSSNLASIQALGERYAEGGRFAGVLAAGEDGRIVHAAAYGLKYPGSDAQHVVSSEWRWASVTKMVAGFLVLQEVEAGRLELDTPIGRFLAGAPADFDRITLRQLLNHTSGLPDPDDQVPDPISGLPPFALGTEDNLAYCMGPLRAEPGAGFNYNACDFIVLAEILFQTTGLSFDALVKQRIAEPLGLSSIEVVTRLGDDAEVQGTKGGRPLDDGLQLASLSADAAMIGKPLDLLRLTQAFMAGEIVRDPALRAEMGRGVPELGYVGLTVWGYEATPDGCSAPLHIVERQGHLRGTKILTLQAPDLKRSIVAFSNRDETDWGWIWSGQGFSWDLASAVFCNDL
jgi:CubicO group peptidase (beta-lactamase class C family)